MNWKEGRGTREGASSLVYYNLLIPVISLIQVCLFPVLFEISPACLYEAEQTWKEE